MLPLFAEAVRQSAGPNCREGGQSPPLPGPLPEGPCRSRKGFLLWESSRLFPDINSTLEMLATVLGEAVETGGNLILLGK